MTIPTDFSAADAPLLTSTARVTTDRPGRYAKQLAGHFKKAGDTHWDAETGTGHFVFDNPERGVKGEADLVASDGVLLIHAQALTAEKLERLERVIGLHLVKFGIKDELSIAWQRGAGEPGLSFTPEDVERIRAEKRAREEAESPADAPTSEA